MKKLRDHKIENILIKNKISQKIIYLTARIILHLFIISFCIIWVIPTLGLLVSSLRTKEMIRTTGWWTAFSPPFRFTLSNYLKVIQTGNMGISFINSLIIAIPSTVMPILIASYAAYAFTWMDFKGKRAIFLIIIGLLVVPLQITLIPVLKLFNFFKLTGTFAGIWIAHCAYGLPFAVYLLHNFFKQLPNEIFDSAFMDGATHFQIFFYLVLPVSLPAFASLCIFQFMWVWNDLLIALIYLGGSPEVAPVTVTISNLVNSYGGGWEYLTSAAFISMILPLMIFFTLQKYFVKGILSGSVKE
ncbi:MAG: carbohydrate ABC transporter permease [Spirochaetes bacterium]|nr:carbohydrate ABC transporter permease [Spirochaetota bacterium]